MTNRFFNTKSALLLTLPTLAAGLTVAFAQTPATPTSQAKGDRQKANLEFYTNQVLPILKNTCYSCHAGEGSSGQLTLSDRASILKGGSSGPGVNLEKPLESLILRAVKGDGRSMPPRNRLSKAQIDTLTKWVEMGLPMPDSPKTGKADTATSKADAIPAKHGPPPVNAETMKFWSFQPVKCPIVPAVKNKAWVTNPIDAFILAKLETNGFAPAPAADKNSLLRRVTYDLIGLPPTSEEARVFLADKSPNAYEKVVDRLLASPQYGEKWARHWLDLVRYAETNSFERDSPKPFVWRYRDYVIRALNEDKPYNQFIREQLAGDELPPASASNDALIATGYYRLGSWDDEPSDPEQARYDELDDIVATTGQVFLGLTVNCARCHDHKIDPIPQKDYYRLLACFQGTTRYGGNGRSPEQNSLRVLGSPEDRQRVFGEENAYRLKLDTTRQQMADIVRLVDKDFAPVEKEEFRNRQAQLAILGKRVPKLLSQERFEQYATLMKQQDALVKSPPRAFEKALCVTETPTIPQTTVMMRGNPHVPGDPVEPGFPSVLAPPAPDIHAPTGSASSGRRLALADWIASPTNPLTARVIVNRLWQHHFGRGLVRSASNFGFAGDKPTHPELLDWLASNFVAEEEKEKRKKGEEENKQDSSFILHPSSFACGWSFKKLHKLILMSSAYRMSTDSNPKALAKDPANDLLWRFDMRRLDAEEVRDSILAANGSLNPKMFGPSIYPTIPQEVLAGQSRPGADWERSTPEEKARRSVYIHIKRSLTVPILASFDAADTDTTCPVRFATTQPTQALGFLNSAFINEQAQVFADFVKKQAGSDATKQVTLTLRRVLQREPNATEVTRGGKFLQTMQQKHHYTADEALKAYCIVALNLNEFIYLD